MLVKDVMTPKLEWVGPDLSVAEVARKMRDLEVGCIPVAGSDALIGMITDRDITCRAVAAGRDPATTRARDIMSQGTSCCFDDQDITEAARLMQEKRVHRLPVLDHDNKMVGLLSLTDVARHCSRELSGELVAAVSKSLH